MKKIDRRRHYILTVDVEAAGGSGNPLIYDIGYAIVDKKGNIYETRSYIIEEIFYDKDLMNTAYYKEKVPMYLKDIEEGRRTVVKFMDMREDLINLALKYKVKTISAYNLMFDRKALTTTIRHILKNDKVKFLPKELGNIQQLCIWCLACETLYIQKSFSKMAVKNNWLTEAGNYKTSAEIGYRFITGDINFIESHTGLEDVLIETKIMAYAFRQNKKRTGGIFANPWKIPNRK